MLTRVSPGTTVIVEHEFVDSSGRPVKGTVTYAIYDMKGNFVNEGRPIQHTSQVTSWRATITIPDTALVCGPGEKYKLVWTMENNGKVVYTATELFTVVFFEDNLATELDIVYVVNSKQSCYDRLVLPATMKPVQMQVRLMWPCSDVGAELARFNVSTKPSFQTTDSSVYEMQVELPITHDNDGMPYILEWAYRLHGRKRIYTEYHFLYAVSYPTIRHINNLRRLIDKARNEDINRNLQFTDVDMSHYLRMGLLEMNAFPPQATYWNFINLPAQVEGYLTKFSGVEALRAQALAEGLSSFDFQGQAVSLSIDRTQYYQTLTDQLKSDIDSNFQKIKRTIVLSGSKKAVLSMHVGASNNFINWKATAYGLARMAGLWNTYGMAGGLTGMPNRLF